MSKSVRSIPALEPGTDFFPTDEPVYAPRYMGKRGEKRRDSIYVRSGTPTGPRPVSESEKKWRGEEAKF